MNRNVIFERTISMIYGSLYYPIDGFPNYKVNNKGMVWSFNRSRHVKWYRGKGCERPHVTLFNNGVSSKLFVATLVAKAFIPNPKPNVYKYVRYKDGNSANNNFTNLEWCRNQTGSKYYVNVNAINKI